APPLARTFRRVVAFRRNDELDVFRDTHCDIRWFGRNIRWFVCTICRFGLAHLCDAVRRSRCRLVTPAFLAAAPALALLGRWFGRSRGARLWRSRRSLL